MSIYAQAPGTPNFWLVVPAAGVGSRMGADRPKQYLELAGKTILELTISRLLELPIWRGVMVAIDDQDYYWDQLPLAANPHITRVSGGKERADSVLNALNSLQAVAAPDDWVVVHDAARPCVKVESIERLLANIDNTVGGLLAVPAADTLKAVDGNQQVSMTLDRRGIWQAQTPQVFRFGVLHFALAKGLQENANITDEASAVELAGYQPIVVEGRSDNIKITRPEDLPLAQFILSQQS